MIAPAFKLTKQRHRFMCMQKNSTITNIIRIFSLFNIFNLLLFYYQFHGSLYTYIRTFITLPQSPVHNFVVFTHHTESHTSFEHVYCEINFSQGIYIYKKAHYFNKGNCIYVFPSTSLHITRDDVNLLFFY